VHVLGGAANFITGFGEPVYTAQNSSYTAFGVDPNFLSYDHTPITITVVARRIGATSAGFNLKYESTTQPGYKNSSASWWTIPGSTQWYSKTYTINDPEFVGYFGYNFKLDSDSTANSQYYIKSITITKTSPLRAAGGVGSLSSADALKQHTLNAVLKQAEAGWIKAGADADLFKGLQVSIADLGGDLLGFESGSRIVIDDDAAGYGWSTGRHVESGKIDLLTALSHELGHVLGLTHGDAVTEPVMADTLAAGVRVLPVFSDKLI
jgi:hypothetical protein